MVVASKVRYSKRANTSTGRARFQVAHLAFLVQCQLGHAALRFTESSRPDDYKIGAHETDKNLHIGKWITFAYTTGEPTLPRSHPESASINLTRVNRLHII